MAGRQFCRSNPKVRRVDDLVIVAHYDRETLYVFVRNAVGHITFHRWYQGRGSYQRWYQFRQRLMRNKHLDLAKCFDLAEEHGINHLVGSRDVIIDGIKYDYESEEVI